MRSPILNRWEVRCVEEVTTCSDKENFTLIGILYKLLLVKNTTGGPLRVALL